MEGKHAVVGCHAQISSERLSDSPHVEPKCIGWCLNGSGSKDRL